MRGRDLLLALLIIGVGVLITAAHRGAFAEAPWLWEGLDEWRTCSDEAWGEGGWTMGERVTTTLPLEGAATLSIENPRGRTSVMPGPANQVQVETVRYGQGTAEAHGTTPRLQVTREGKVLRLTVTGSEEATSNARLDLRVHAPQGVAVETR